MINMSPIPYPKTKKIPLLTSKGLLCRERELYLNQIKATFLEPHKMTPTALACYQEFIKSMEAKKNADKISQSTYQNYLTSFRNFGLFLSHENNCTLQLSSISVKFLHTFENYLKLCPRAGRNKPLRHNSVVLKLQRLRSMLDFAVLEEYIFENPLSALKFTFEAVQEKYFLNRSEFELLKNYEFASAVLSHTRDCFIFQVLTGLSFKDAQRFDAEKHTVDRSGTLYIKLKRQKTNT
jgi:site-specific recombinase XerD